MICQRMMVGSGGKKETWRIRVNTEATTAGEKKTGIPFNLYNQPGVTLEVDWGDGTSDTLTSADYAVDDSTASVHEYVTAGIYTVQITSSNWRRCFVFVKSSYDTYTSTNLSLNNATIALYWYERTLIETDVLPQMNGTQYYDSNTSPTMIYNIKSFDFLFERCTKLTYVPSALFGKNSTISSFQGTFLGCTSLASIPGDLFAGVNGKQFVQTFEGCFSLTAIPASLFSTCTRAESFEKCFKACISLTSIPDTLFSTCNASYFNSCFMYCSNISTLPLSLCAQQTNAKSFQQTFVGMAITEVPAGFFDSCTKVQTFRRVFSDCSALGTLPAYLFTHNEDATSFEGAFGGYPSSGSSYNFNGISFSVYGANNTALTSIPETLFSGATKANTFDAAFRGCEALTQIPENLFSTNTLAQSFRETFKNCLSLTAIPANLFAPAGNNVTTVAYAFEFDSEITDIPDTLFSRNPAITTFSCTFNGCSKITSIPRNLFSVHTEAKFFSATFSGCETVSSIPQDLFANNEKATDFDSVFHGCTGITSVPQDLFAANVLATSFYNAFSGSSVATIPATLFSRNPEITNIAYVFLATPITDIPQNLFANNTKLIIASGAFSRCTNLGNFSIRFRAEGINSITGSPSVTHPYYFADPVAGATRTVYVPTGSTTETTFNAEASTLGLTIIGE